MTDGQANHTSTNRHSSAGAAYHGVVAVAGACHQNCTSMPAWSGTEHPPARWSTKASTQGSVGSYQPRTLPAYGVSAAGAKLQQDVYSYQVCLLSLGGRGLDQIVVEALEGDAELNQCIRTMHIDLPVW